jgi:hypothetical protein
MREIQSFVEWCNGVMPDFSNTLTGKVMDEDLGLGGILADRAVLCRLP